MMLQVSFQAGDAKPDPLMTVCGERISSSADWERTRRPEILELFREHVYGRNAVDRPATLRFEVVEKGVAAFEDGATRRKARILYSGPGGVGEIGVTLYLPVGEKPKACFLLILNRSRKIIDDAEADPSGFWPVQDIVGRGYATAAFHYEDVAVDDPKDRFKSGVFGVFRPAQTRAKNAWGAVGAWAWGASRVIDYLAPEPA